MFKFRNENTKMISWVFIHSEHSQWHHIGDFVVSPEYIQIINQMFLCLALFMSMSAWFPIDLWLCQWWEIWWRVDVYNEVGISHAKFRNFYGINYV